VSDDDIRGRFLPAGSGTPAIGTPGSLTTIGGSGSGTSGAQTANTGGLGVSQTLGEVVSKAPNPALRVSQELAEIVAKNPGVPMRVSQAFVEIVVERDYAGWETIVLDEPTGNPITDVVSF
jgi:hypothetical protein